jgi:hypothetical protein
MDSKISELDLVSVVDQNDVLPIVNGGITKKVKVSQLVQDLQSVTDKGATTTNPIIVTALGDDAITAYAGSGTAISGNAPEGTAISGISINGDGVYGQSIDGVGVFGYSNSGAAVQGYSETGNGLYAYSVSGIPIETYGNGNNTPSIDVNLGNTNKGVVIESGTSSTGNPIEVKKNGVTKFRVAQNGDVTTDVISANGDVLTLESGASKIEINDNISEIIIDGGSFIVNCPISTPLVQAGQYTIPALNTAPATATSTGALGEIRYTAGFIYVCIATNTWRRTALTSW